MADPDPKKLKPLRPAPLGESSGTGSALDEPPTDSRPQQWTTGGRPISKLPPRRTSVKIACQSCRHKRIKCDGQRPRCGQCANRRTSCVYAGEQGETMSDALKRKNASLEHENTKYKDLINLLLTRSGEELSEILRRVKTSNDPLTVVDEIRKANLLLPEIEATSPSTTTDSENVTQLDQNALESSTIRVPALPWTNIAGDGLVSELVTNFFIWDGAYLFPSVDAEAFVKDMTSGDVDRSRWCSPLLVNAMCAHSCQTVPRAEEYGLMTNQNIPDRFLDEAKFLIEREQGCASIPTVQALMLMYLTMTCQGKDRAGRSYRQIALDMVRRLRLENRYRSTLDGSEMTMRERKLVSKALWGLFLLESRIAFFYFEPSQIPPPQIPRPFGVDDDTLPGATRNTDVLGRPFEESSSNVPLVPGIVDCACSISVLFYDVMIHNTNSERVWGNDADIYVLKRLYSRLKNVENNLPPRFLAKNNFTPSTCFLKLDMDEVGFSIIQTLRHRTLFEMPASQPGTTIQELCLYHCRSTIETTEAMVQSGTFHCAHWWYLYVALHPMVLLLDRPIGAETFTNACRLMRFGSEKFQVCDSLLNAMQAFAWAAGQAIPAPAQQFLPERRTEGDIRHGPSLSFALPRQDDIWDLITPGPTLKKERLDDEEDIGLLIQNWMLHDVLEN